jgi:protoporphyrinogen oxidase
VGDLPLATLCPTPLVDPSGSAAAVVSAGPSLDRRFLIIGGGPAGLTAAYELAKLGVRPLVVEKLDTVGGLARTVNYKGFHFDLGGHRFFTKVPDIDKMWHEVLQNDFLRRPRLSRIYYKGKFFHYPLRPLNALAGLGILQSLLVVLSYLRWQLFPYRREDTFEQWVTNRFGRHLFLTFFKTYTEKVWGIPCSTLKAEWAAQRIKDLSLRTAIVSMFLKPRRTIKTLIEEFHYPRLGPGMMWNAVKAEIEQRQGIVRVGCEVVRINRQGLRIEGVVIAAAGGPTTITASDFISSMPVTEFIQRLDPPPPAAVVKAAAHLTYRDFLTVCLIVNKRDTFPDNWIYVHSPEVRVGRIQNFRRWSPDLVPVADKSSLGLEYFCAEGDELWTSSDADLIELGKREVERIGLARYADLEDGCVIRVPKAYPVYDSSYREHLTVVREFIDQLENFQSVGRNGLHRYNNQDHAMLTGILAVRNSLGGEDNDLWRVNTDQDYQEEELGQEDIPQLEQTLAHAFPRLDRLALGVSLGLTAGLILCLATLILVLKGGAVVGPNLALLSQYFPGYRVSASGAVVGLLYGFAAGFLGGWTLAFLRNATAVLYMVLTRRRAERLLMRDLLEYL